MRVKVERVPTLRWRARRIRLDLQIRWFGRELHIRHDKLLNDGMRPDGTPW